MVQGGDKKLRTSSLKVPKRVKNRQNLSNRLLSVCEKLLTVRAELNYVTKVSERNKKLLT